MSDAALQRKLERLGLRSRGDLILHLPLRYEDETALATPGAALPGAPVLVEAQVLRAEVAYRPRRQLVVHTRWGEVPGVPLALRFFNFYPSQLKMFQRAIDAGRRVRAYGELRGGWLGAEMAHPRVRVVSDGEPLATALTPVYPAAAGVTQAVLRKLIDQALEQEALEDTLPEAMRRRFALGPIGEAVRLLHRPPPGVDTRALVERTHPAWRRVKFDELLAQQLSMRLAYRARRGRSAPPIAADGPLLRAMRAALPFELTLAQRHVLDEVLADLAQPHPMQRLLQGDVGSGKTIVAALACLAAADAGWQSAVMAPTEILAEQHLRKFGAWLEPLGVKIGWLHGALPAAARREVLGAVSSGEVSIAIGTHALFQSGVQFARLGLAVVDEQHRFGVRQRLRLRRKAERAVAQAVVPHQLMMSATPIPRTLSMSYYADLDVSVIDMLPPGRTPVRTRLVSEARRAEVLERIRAACADGQQAYWVCPVIEESGERDLKTALETHAALARELRGLNVGLVHGRLSAVEKNAAMQDFASGRTQLLVATTVIEVGVDVPNASLMVIEHAERFGLAQLHQLRGRIGRGTAESVCILLYAAPLSDAARTRLRVIYENADGFEVARQDLLLRGPGEVLGERQSGAPLLRFADLEGDVDLLEQAHEAAATLLAADPVQARRHVARWLGAREELARV